MRNSKIKYYVILSLAYLIFLLSAYLILGLWFTDDAFISFRYAENLIKGNGLVFNIGEKVQGYTNFLWILFIALLKLFSLEFTISSLLINSLSGLLLGFLIFNHISGLFPKISDNLRLLITILIISSSNLLSWSIGGGLEGPFFTLFLYLGYYYFTKRDLRKEYLLFSAISSAIATLIRPEGFIFFGVILFYSIYTNKKINKNSGFYFAAYLLIILVYLLWVQYYYGQLLPNTFYAKVNLGGYQFIDGIRYTYRYFMTVPLFSVLILFSVLNFNRLSMDGKLAIIFILIYVLYVISVGGDFMSAFRFFVPITPFFAVPLSNLIGTYSTQLANYKNIKMIYALLSFFILYNLLSLSFFVDYKYEITNYNMIENGKITAEYFNRNLPSETLIATSAIGSFGYYSKHNILDVVGLTDTSIARSKSNIDDDLSSHKRSNTDYVLRRKPGVILFGKPPGEVEPIRAAEKEIYSNYFFQNNYELHIERLEDNRSVKYYFLKGTR